MSELHVSQSRLATYLRCPWQYRFKYDLDLEVRTQAERYFGFGNALHETIEAVCDTVRERGSISDEAIRELAEEVFDDKWATETDVSDYPTRAVYEQDRAKAAAAIQEFFEAGPGIRHARTSLATEAEVEFERDGVTYLGYIDNVLETEEGIELVDYKTSDIDLPFGRKNYVEAHAEGAYYPDRVKPAIQASLYLEGVRELELFEEGMARAFTFYVLVDDHDITRRPSGLDVTVSGRPRAVGEQCLDNAEIIWPLIHDAALGIIDSAYEIDSWQTVREETCTDCSFRRSCSRYLNEVSQY